MKTDTEVAAVIYLEKVVTKRLKKMQCYGPRAIDTLLANADCESDPSGRNLRSFMQITSSCAEHSFFDTHFMALNAFLNEDTDMLQFRAGNIRQQMTVIALEKILMLIEARIVNDCHLKV